MRRRRRQEPRRQPRPRPSQPVLPPLLRMPGGAPVSPARLHRSLSTRPLKAGGAGPAASGLDRGTEAAPKHDCAEPTCPGPRPALAMTLAASSQRSQIIRSKFRSVLQLRIHRRYQDPNLSGSFAASPVSDPDPWISASGPALAPAPASPSGPAPFLFNPGVLPEPEYCPWRSLKKESPKISQHWREPKPKGNLTYHQYMPPEPRQGTRADPQAEGSALGPPGPPLWEGTNLQQPPPRMKPTPFTSFPPGVPGPSPPSHKLELQTLKLEELTVSELRQQLRLRGLPVSGTKSMLLERMRGGAPPRERPKPRREDSPLDAPRPRFRAKALGAARRPGSFKPSPTPHSPPPPPHAAETVVMAPAPAPPATTAPAPAPIPFSAPASTALTLEEELQEAIRRAQLLPNRGIDDILEDQVKPEDPLPPILLDFPGSFDVLSPSPDSEGLSSVFSSSIPSLSHSPRGPTDSLDWLEALSGGPLLGCGPPASSIFSADLSDFSGTRLWDLLEDPW
ncbi:MEF2-activating motif and SAP domain-containing transcriptional regulator isoform X2 [Phacochoerus africanus]|uniref:MEF2-activating motif and SAP domain-containing transcriptional regulator isoform X2 n=1 Tax=Phacochoerus africanus TaxID=41426 RepID=UPI001FD8ABA3|nr:MEF2-activating motif and SAP domain-containing transcriptional regulator isoform X2 [Phacochoerus africanus]